MLRRIAVICSILVVLAAWYAYSRVQVLHLHPMAGRIELSEALPGEWDRVCVLSPYSTNEMAEEIVGKSVNVELRSSIDGSDSIALLVTMKSGRVEKLIEVPRNSVDFAALGGKCFPREDSVFHVPEKGHPYASPA